MDRSRKELIDQCLKKEKERQTDYFTLSKIVSPGSRNIEAQHSLLDWITWRRCFLFERAITLGITQERRFWPAAGDFQESETISNWRDIQQGIHKVLEG